jgi:hypothetical protein
MSATAARTGGERDGASTPSGAGRDELGIRLPGTDVPFGEPWHARVFAAAVVSCERLGLPWDAFRDELKAAVADDPDRPYYESFTVALERLTSSGAAGSRAAGSPGAGPAGGGSPGAGPAAGSAAQGPMPTGEAGEQAAAP